MKIEVVEGMTKGELSDLINKAKLAKEAKRQEKLERKLSPMKR